MEISIRRMPGVVGFGGLGVRGTSPGQEGTEKFRTHWCGDTQYRVLCKCFRVRVRCLNLYPSFSTIREASKRSQIHSVVWQHYNYLNHTTRDIKNLQWQEVQRALRALIYRIYRNIACKNLHVGCLEKTKCTSENWCCFKVIRWSNQI